LQGNISNQKLILPATRAKPVAFPLYRPDADLELGLGTEKIYVKHKFGAGAFVGSTRIDCVHVPAFESVIIVLPFTLPVRDEEIQSHPLDTEQRTTCTIGIPSRQRIVARDAEKLAVLWIAIPTRFKKAIAKGVDIEFRTFHRLLVPAGQIQRMMFKQSRKKERARRRPLPALVVATEWCTVTVESKKLPELRVEIAATLPQQMRITDRKVVKDQATVIRDVAIEKKQCVVGWNVPVVTLDNGSCAGSDGTSEVLRHGQSYAVRDIEIRQVLRPGE